MRANTISFSASASEELTQDWMSVTMHVQRDGTQANEVQQAVRQALDTALAEARKAAKGHEGMEVRTSGFSVQPRYSNQGRIAGWQGSAQLVLEGTDGARIAQTVGRLGTLQVGQVQYGLSRALRERQESALTQEAIRQFKSRAQEMAQAFGFKGYSLGEISVSSTDPGVQYRAPMMAMRAKAMEAADAPLPVEPGKGTLSVTVSGTVILSP
ncbi:SIMPL domain-containing protein [Aquabacterium sp. A3]|uniref:SIMPL domain-containing protein n=1 Tax=Aquabacterium sp. A3 TaxID=3132829 RepID=UPI0031195D67